MHVHASNRPKCRNCKGFSVVSIAISDRRRDGSRVLLRVVCHACQGTGRSLPVTSAQAGR
nr:hypothetical protein [Streptomyces sp. TRM68416]